MNRQDCESDLASKIDHHVQAFVDLHRFSGAILVGCDSKILVRKGYGLANRDDDIPNTSHTKFLVGSIAKQFTAAVILLLGYIVEQITGKTYEVFVAENILKPLEMKDSGYHYHAEEPKDRAVGYVLLHDELVNAHYLDMSTIRAAGGLHSTVEDLWLWDQALYSKKIISSKSLETMFMFTPFLANYGYGVGIAQQFGRRLIGHGGGVEGFSSYLGHYLDEKLCIAVLSNIEETNTAGIAKDLAAIVFAEDYKTPRRPTVSAIDPDTLSIYEGQYQLAPGITLTIQQQGKTLLAHASGGSKVIFHHESEDAFCRRPTDDRIAFCRNKKGEVTHLILRYGRLEKSARRTGSSQESVPVP